MPDLTILDVDGLQHRLVTTDAEGNVVRQYRTVPVPVSEPLWRTAYDFAGLDDPAWANSISKLRPDGSQLPPKIHCARTTLLGTGPELVAAEKATTRQWLLQCMAPETKHEVVGLEMEAFGAWMACRANDTPFLVVKGVQDDATEAKDEVDKDAWRDYAAEASAAFTVEIIRRFEPSSADPVSTHTRDALRTALEFRKRLPKELFERTVRRAESLGFLRAGVFAETALPPEHLIPDAAHPSIRLHGEGGSGKSTLVRFLMQPMLEAGLVPVFLDLKRYSLAAREERSFDDSQDELIRLASAPRIDLRRLRQLAALGRLAVVVDAVNEVGVQTRTALVNLLLRLRGDGDCYILVTDRLGSEDPQQPFQHYELEPLSESTVEGHFDKSLGTGAWKELTPSLQEAFRRPFFLNLALTAGKDVASADFLAEIFEQFGELHAGLGREELDRVAYASVAVLRRGQGIRSDTIGAEVDDGTIQALVEADVLEADAGFTHDLWRDYFVGRRLAADRSLWQGPIFDLATVASASFESLGLALEQIEGTEAKDDFVAEVFDWNYLGALVCVAGGEESGRGPSDDMRFAVLAALQSAGST